MSTLGKHREMRIERKTESDDIILKVMNELLMLRLLGNADQNRIWYQAECQLFFLLLLTLGILFQLNILPVCNSLID